MQRVEQILQTMIAEADVSPSARAAAEHALFPAGKRLRAKLVLALAQDLNGSISTKTLNLAAGIEMLHCASLVHDDLPQLDNDLLRRGRPTVHAQFGAGAATLVGDILAALPFALAQFPAAIAAQAYVQLCDGQVLDLLRASSTEALIEIHRKKTGALFALCSEALCTDKNSNAIKLAVRDFAVTLGIEFQLRNDLGDVAIERGQSSPSDERNLRFTPAVLETLPNLLMQFKAQREAQQLVIENLSSCVLIQTKSLITEICGA